VGGRGGRVAEGACDDIGCHVLCSEQMGLSVSVTGERLLREIHSYEKSEDESRENGKNGPNTESVGDGCDPRI
jgi:hypothetical protein